MSGTIAQVQSGDRNLNQAQQNITQQVAPLLKNPFLFGLILTNVQLKTGDNSIAHGLGQALQGWSILRMQDSFAQIFDKQNTNPNPKALLILNASAPVTVNLYVF